MEILLDNSESDKNFKKMLAMLPAVQNGPVAESLAERGLEYDRCLGASVVSLKEIAQNFEKNHLLALKLWNKKWRETMILASLVDEPEKVTEEQMDFWIKTAPAVEVIEQIVMNLFTKTPYAYVKSLEWCRGKKENVKIAGLLMMGRLAFTSDDDIDEMFFSFFDVLLPLSKDKSLFQVFYRSFCQLGRRSRKLNIECLRFAQTMKNEENENSVRLADEVIAELASDFVQDGLK